MEVAVCAVVGVPVVLYLYRKYQEYKWGWCNETELLTNKIFIVTGANSGLGKATVEQLAKRDATVIMAVKNLNKGNEAMNDIKSKVHAGKLHVLELNLASLKSIKIFVDNVKRLVPAVHVLINNGGVSIPYFDKTEDGFEMNFGVNHLGHFYLTNLLLDKLKQSSPSRIVIVSSKLYEGVLKNNFNRFDDIRNEINSKMAYAKSKLANVYFGKELDVICRENNFKIETFIVCPGFCYTNLFRYSNVNFFKYLLMAPVAFFFMRSALQGCQTIVLCATSSKVNGLSGQIFRDCKLYQSNFKLERRDQQNLWKISEDMISRITIS